MKRLIECVPNFSEGRDQAKVDALVEAMSGVAGAWVLDRTSDPDHNRSVVTLAGEPEAISKAAIRGVGAAAKLIDLTHHTGAHPRIGATDVLPFVPLEGISMEDCIALARHVGQEIWARYHIPVYFYEEAAKRPERVNLENVRKGGFEGLLADTLRDPDRSPDIGEPRLHPTAGAIAIGVRKLLIAYNIHLNTSDVFIAKKIARAIRFSSGGLRYVKAMGVHLKSRGIAQVSINLTDFEQTPLHRIFEMVKREAERHGCAVTGSEIVGLIPRQAIERAAEYYLQLENSSSSRVLEDRLAAAISRQSLDVGQLETPIPLILDTLREATRKLSEELNSEAPKEGSSTGMPTERMAALRRAARDAASANLEIVLAGMQLFERWMQLETGSGPSMLSDFRAGRDTALAAAHAALDSVEADLKSIPATPNMFSD